MTRPTEKQSNEAKLCKLEAISAKPQEWAEPEDAYLVRWAARMLRAAFNLPKKGQP
jgi:hypothetical protein